MTARLFLKFLSFLILINLVFAENTQVNSSPGIFNEKFVINALHSLNSAQAAHQATHGNYGSLEQLRSENFIDSVLATGEKYSYVFTVTTVLQAPNQFPRFQVSAVPQRYSKSGRRSFYVDESGVIRGADRNGEPATIEDSVVPQICFANHPISNMRTFIGAEATYHGAISVGNYGTLPQLVTQGLINPYLLNGESCGYMYRVQVIDLTPTTASSFEVKSVPQQYGVTGFISYFTDQTGVIRGADRGGAEANADDPPVE
jgi:hypothetical protein